MQESVNLNLLLLRKGFNVSSMARRIGHPESSFALKVKNTNNLTYEDMVKISAACRITINTLIRHMRQGLDRKSAGLALDKKSSIDELQNSVDILEERERNSVKEQEEYRRELIKANIQLGKDIRAEKLEVPGYISPLTKLKEKYPKQLSPW